MSQTLLIPRWIVPVRPHGVVLTDHAVAIDGGRIVAILPCREAEIRYSRFSRLELRSHAIMPGLINLHTHSAMSLMRGLADDLPLMNWLNEHIWPAEAQHVSREFVHDGTQLACADMLKSGVTTFNDMYFFPDAVARAALTMHMRAAIAMIALEFPTAYAANADEYLDKGLAAHAEMKDEPLLSFTFGPHAPYTVSDRTFQRIATLASDLNLPIHTHIHETRQEIADAEREYGMRPLERLHGLGIVTPNLLAVHAVHLSDGDIDLLARNGCHVAHCPASNLKLASGLAQVASLATAGVNVGIGTDGAASNNRLDMMSEMRLAALLAKGVSGNAAAVPAADALSMATLNAAMALGLEQLIGSLEPGKCADIAAIDFSNVEMAPCFDVVSHIVYAASSENISHVWINGELLLKDRRLTKVDEQELNAKARSWKARIQP